MIQPSWTLFCFLLCILFHLGNFLLPTTDHGPGPATTVYFPRVIMKLNAKGRPMPHLDLDELNVSIRRLKSSSFLREIGDSLHVCFGQTPEWIFVERNPHTTLFLRSDIGVSAGLTPANQQAVQSAIRSISGLNVNLKNEHWKLLVVPVPSKVSICRDSIRWPLLEVDKLSRFPIDRDGADQLCDVLFAGLKGAGVDFVDLRPDFRRETEGDPFRRAIFPAAESHWRGLGIEIAADRVTTKLHDLYGLKTNRANVQMETVNYYCDIARALEVSAIVPTPLSKILEIKDSVPFNHKVSKDPPRSLLALAGTSYSGQYSWFPGAGFAATLDAMLPSTRVMSFAEAGHGSLRTMITFLAKRSEIYTQLASRPDHLITPYDKYLIWEFPIRDIRAFVEAVFPFSPQNDISPQEGDPIAVDAKNGLEIVNGKSFFWLNNQPVRLTFREASRQRLLLLSWINSRGPDLERAPNPTLEFSIGDRRLAHPIIEEGRDAIAIPIPESVEQITLRCINLVGTPPQPSDSREKRTLLIGIQDLKAKLLDREQQ
jgi:hypothetical protein